MNSGINLAGTTQQPKFKETPQGLRTVRILAIGLLFVVAACSVMFFILIATSPLSRLKKEQADAQQSLQRHQSEVASLLLLKERTDSIKTLLATRPLISKIDNEIDAKIPDNVTLEGISITGNAADFTVGAKSLADADTFINNVIAGAQQKEYRRVILKSITADQQNGQFLVTIEVTIT